MTALAGSDAPPTASEHDPEIRQLIEDALSGIGMAAAGANVAEGTGTARIPDPR